MRISRKPDSAAFLDRYRQAQRMLRANTPAHALKGAPRQRSDKRTIETAARTPRRDEA